MPRFESQDATTRVTEIQSTLGEETLSRAAHFCASCSPQEALLAYHSRLWHSVKPYSLPRIKALCRPNAILDLCSPFLVTFPIQFTLSRFCFLSECTSPLLPYLVQCDGPRSQLSKASQVTPSQAQCHCLLPISAYLLPFSVMYNQAHVLSGPQRKPVFLVPHPSNSA